MDAMKKADEVWRKIVDHPENAEAYHDFRPGIEIIAQALREERDNTVDAAIQLMEDQTWDCIDGKYVATPGREYFSKAASLLESLKPGSPGVGR